MGVLSLLAGASTSVKVAAGITAASVLLGGSLMAGSAIGKSLRPPADDTTATVTRVVDGDTLVAWVAEAEITIRLLNVDTPETKDPNGPVECLGAEATTFLTKRLPIGSAIKLEYDQERTDRYGRTLAGVFESGSLVNEEIAAAGWGVAVVFEPNRKFYDTVLAAQLDAEDKKVGLFDVASECTLPGIVREATTTMQQAGKAKPSTSQDALAAAAALSTARSEAGKIYREIKNGTLASGTAALSSYSRSFRTGEEKKLKLAITKAKKRHGKLTTKAADLKEEEDRQAEAKRLAIEERRLEKERREAEELAREEQKEREAEQRRSVAAQRQADAEQRETEKESEEDPVTDSGQDDSDNSQPSRDDEDSAGPPSNYNGPRCYAPGGKSWKPC